LGIDRTIFAMQLGERDDRFILQTVTSAVLAKFHEMVDEK
jgi:hypothetical protein